MQKIKTVFKIDRESGLADPTVHPDSIWYQDEDCVATVKSDGRACAIIGGKLYVRYDRKIQDKFRSKVGVAVITEDMLKPVPENGIPCEPTHDPKTGHHPFWVPPSEAWIYEAFCAQFGDTPPGDGTYELIGPKIRCNPQGLDSHLFVRHGSLEVSVPDRSFEGLRLYLKANPSIEGLVFHKYIDGVLHFAKVRQKDFGFEWNVAAEGVRSKKRQMI